MTRLLHTESSSGWGGQEIRILKEARGMRKRGHEVIFAVQKGGGLVARAQKEGFFVYELNFRKPAWIKTLWQLCALIRRHRIEVINTHSSLDAWIGGIAARATGRKVIRTRHLSTPIRRGLNSFLLYKKLADFVVTTSSGVIAPLCVQSGRSSSTCKCIPTGVDPGVLHVDPQNVKTFRESLKISQDVCLIGTACFVRSWKGVRDLLKAAKLLQEEQKIKWVVVGGGYVKDYQKEAASMGLEDTVFFTGHLEPPYEAIAAMDVFALCSTAHEGISQATLQAAYLERPLLTTDVGGLSEVCIEGKTGKIVPVFSPEKIAEAALWFLHHPLERKTLGQRGKKLVLEQFTEKMMLDQMEATYQCL